MLFATYFVVGDVYNVDSKEVERVPSIVKSRGKRMSPKNSEFQKEGQQRSKKTL